MYDIQFLQTYLSVIISCAIMTIIIVTKMNRNLGSMDEIHAFTNLSVGSLLMMLTQSLWTISVLLNPFPPLFNLYVNALDLIFASVVYYSLYRYTTISINRIFQRKEKGWVRFLILLPLLIMSVFNYGSIYTHAVFYIGSDGTYQRGPLFLVHMGVCYLYFILSWVKIGVSLFQCKKEERRTILHLLLFTCIPFLRGLLQVVSNSAPYTVMSISLAIFIFFVTKQENRITRDDLTKLNNRAWMVKQLSHRMLHAKENPFYVMMCDIDRFKTINDTYGHLAGDQALVLVADVFRQLKQQYPGLFASRYGGDEFLLVMDGSVFDQTAFEKDCAALIDAFTKERSLPFGVSLSLGCHYVCASDSSYQNVIRKADEKLYMTKRAKGTQR